MDHRPSAKAQLDRIEGISVIIRQLDQLRTETCGEVRAAYTAVIRNELFRFLRNIDRYKMIICEALSENDAAELINRAQFPNLE
jgi:hypothetical protein